MVNAMRGTPMRGAMNSGMSAGMVAVRAESAHCPRTSPATLPRAQRTRLSVTSCRTRRPRPAPSAVRIANSRMRVRARDNVRLATFTQAMNRRSATPAVRSKSCGRTSVTRSSCSGVTVIPQPTFLPARSFCSVAAMTSISARACSMVTPGLSRATADIHRPPVSRKLASMVMGSQRAAPCGMSNRSGKTPTTRVGRPSTVMERPTTPSSAA